MNEINDKLGIGFIRCNPSSLFGNLDKEAVEMTFGESTMLGNRLRFQQQDLQPHIQAHHEERISKDKFLNLFFTPALSVFDLLPTI